MGSKRGFISVRRNCCGSRGCSFSQSNGADVGEAGVAVDDERDWRARMETRGMLLSAKTLIL